MDAALAQRAARHRLGGLFQCIQPLGSSANQNNAGSIRCGDHSEPFAKAAGRTSDHGDTAIETKYRPSFHALPPKQDPAFYLLSSTEKILRVSLGTAVSTSVRNAVFI